ncbi:MAG: hypothetical protein ACYDB3_07520, partial [Acidimicrobiales bacterium]
LARLARASALAPFAPPTPPATWPAWRRGLLGQVVELALVEALFASVAPAVATVTLLMTVSLAVGALVMGGRPANPAAGRVLGAGVGATAMTVILLAPWSVALLWGPARWQALTGVATTPHTGPGWGALLRLAVGPIGDTPLAFAFLAAAALPLVIGSRRRLVWAGHAWVLAVAAWTVAWAEGRGWLGAMAVPAQMLLVPAALGIALAIGLGVAAFERDLSAYRFGWRQAAAVMAAGAAVVGALPVLAASANGRWDLPLTGYGEATSWMAAHDPSGGFRVLWLADPR